MRRLRESSDRAKEAEDSIDCLGGHYFLSIDGTGYFSSDEIHCNQCCNKKHRDGRVSYYHQLLGALLVNPDYNEVFPLAPEPFMRQDGKTKND